MIRIIPTELADRAARVRFLANARGNVVVEDDGVSQPLPRPLAAEHALPIGFIQPVAGQDAQGQLALAMLSVLVGSERAQRDDVFQRVHEHLVNDLNHDEAWELSGSDVLHVLIECECGLR